MKILILCDVLFPQTIGGAGRVARELGLAWKRLGEEVQYLTRFTGTAPTEDHVETRYFPSLARGLPTSFRRVFGETVRRFQPDVVHFHQPLSACLAIPPSFSLPLVYTFHSSWGQELLVKSSRWPLTLRRTALPLFAWVERRMLYRATAVTVLSRFSQRELRKLYRRDAIVIPGGVDSQHFRPDGQLGSSDGVRLITLRNLVPRMGLDGLIRAMKLLPSHVRLDIGGEGPLREELEGLIRVLDLETRVHLCGHIPERELPRFYSSGHCFVIPSQALEGFGLVILESLSCGTPVVGTKVGAIPELLERFDRSWLIETPTPEGIAATVQSVLAKKFPPRQELHDCIAAEFDWEKIAQQYRNMFHRLT
ncbi:MAG: glycosyltransferase family 4 protein [Acidobacteria bacterium]|nr:glycosyltransferase family 4 protein [Acidobacteriota bacterium]